jgi:hypothetical protein
MLSFFLARAIVLRRQVNQEATILISAFSLLGCVQEKPPDFVAHCGEDAITKLSVLDSPPIEAETYLGLANPEEIPDESLEIHDAWLTLPTGKVMYCRLVFFSSRSIGIETWAFEVVDGEIDVSTNNKWRVGN